MILLAVDHVADGEPLIVGRDDDVPEAGVEGGHRRRRVRRVDEHRVPPDRAASVQQDREGAGEAIRDLPDGIRELDGRGDAPRNLERDEAGVGAIGDGDDRLRHCLLPFFP